jgi:DNA-binding NtrC family response regulator
VRRTASVTAPAKAARSLVIDLDQPLESVVERVVEAALALEGGNRSRAAQRLGISLRTIQRHLARGLIHDPGRAT